MPLQDAPEQDLHVAQPAPPDINWPAYRKPQFLQIPVGQLDKPHQLVMMRNSHRETTHVIIDRFMVGHELLPGQVKEIDLLAEDIEYFQRRRRPELVGRDQQGNPQLHPVIIEGLRDGPGVVEQVQAETAERKKLRTP